MEEHQIYTLELFSDDVNLLRLAVDNLKFQYQEIKEPESEEVVKRLQFLALKLSEAPEKKPEKAGF